MLENYDKLTIKSPRGIYRRGTPEEVPLDHLVDSQNLSYKPGNFGIRPGSSLFFDFGIPVNDVYEWNTTTYSVLAIDNFGNFWLYQNSVVNKIYNVPNATNFQAVNFFSRLFIVPYNAAGPIGNLLMLYFNSSNAIVIRQCGEDAPTSLTAMTATVNSSGSQTGSNSATPTVVNQQGIAQNWQDLTALEVGGNTTVDLKPGTGLNTSNYLQITGFKFTGIQDTATILGIVVNITEQQLGGTSAIYDANVILLGIASNSKDSVTPWNGTPTVATYGSSSDLWGNANVAGADVNASSFGVQLALQCTQSPGNGAEAAVQGVSITVYWQTSAGNVAAGTYNINVVYETDTGFISPPSTSPNIAIVVTVASDGSSITLNNVPTSPDVPYVISRQIIIALQDSLGDVGTYYFVPTNDGGYIPDNTTTTTTLSFFVTDLVASADNLFNLRARIPSGRNINVYSARLVLLGFLPPDECTLRLSNTANPETFDQTLESIVVSKNDGYYCTNTTILNSAFYIFKNKGIQVTYDNGSDPVSWDVEPIDDAVGTTFTGLSSITPTTNGNTSGITLFADISGVYAFTGYVQRPAVTWKIQDLWDDLNDINQVRIVIDIENDRFHVSGFNV